MVALISSTSPLFSFLTFFLTPPSIIARWASDRSESFIIVLNGNLRVSLSPSVEEILHTRQVFTGLSVGLHRLADDNALHLFLLYIAFDEGK